MLRRVAMSLPKGLTRQDFRKLESFYFDPFGFDKPRIVLVRRTPKPPPRTERFTKKPSRAIALLEAKKLHGKPWKDWTPLGLLGHFHQKYEEWCLAEYRHGGLRSQLLLVDSAVRERGAEMMGLAIEALFGPPLDWVTGKTLSFIIDEDKWSRFVAPAIAQMRKRSTKGEQSEYRGETETEYVAVRRK